ncbi:MAG TPA: hypothetical protein PKZ25_06170, partial [Candidatus Hydrogenedentes bacterium]|nr:hypothetical protein [Candidatus Hydrogenedentota bacterium]
MRAGSDTFARTPPNAMTWRAPVIADTGEQGQAVRPRVGAGLRDGECLGQEHARPFRGDQLAAHGAFRAELDRC